MTKSDASSALSVLQDLVIATWSTRGSPRERLMEALSTIQCRDLVRLVAAELLDDDAALSLVAKRSFDHPTGVSKIVFTSPDSMLPEVRLHFWPPVRGRLGNELSIHDHRWDFCSNLLFGSLQHETFSINEDGDDYFGIKFVKSPGRSVYDIINLGKTPVSRISMCNLNTGDSYWLPSNRLHRMVNVGEEVACTLFLRAPYSKNNTEVYHKRRDSVIQGSYPDRLSVSLTRTMLELVGREAHGGGGR